MKVTLKNLWTVPLFVLTLSACSQDPFGGEQFVTQKPEPSITPQVAPVTPQENYTLDYLPVMNFVENEEGTYQISGKVPAPGTALLDIANLPKGATFNAADQKLVWKPDFEAANDPKDPNIIAKTYEVKIRLASSESPQSVWERGALLVVKDTSRKFEIATGASVHLNEQKEFVQTITINCEDFPKGPFKLTPHNLPLGATYKMIADNKFEIRFTPTLAEVTVNNTNPNYYLTKVFDVNYLVTSPRGQVATTSKWNISDTRQRPVLVLPENLSQGLDVSFTATAVDPNLEIQPKIDLYNKPNFGKITTSLDTTSVPNTANLRIRWENIPPGKLGSSETLTLRACNYTSTKILSNCENRSLKVTFAAQTHQPPKINRTQWPIGQKKEIQIKANQNISLPILDGEDTTLKVKVEILPKDVQSEVTWTNHTLTIKPQTPGEKSALVIATSLHNMISAEAFEYTVPAPSPTPTPSPSPVSEEGDLE